MLTVRSAAPADAPAVAGVHVRAWQAAYRGLLPDEHLDGLRADEARMARYRFGVDDPEAPYTVVAETDGGALVGFATIGPCRDDDARDAAELYALYVDPPQWGTGAGRRLLAEARSLMTARGYRRAVLWVLAGNRRAQRVYEVDGWEADGAARHEEVWAVPADVVRYRRPLP